MSVLTQKNCPQKTSNFSVTTPELSRPIRTFPNTANTSWKEESASRFVPLTR